MSGKVGPVWWRMALLYFIHMLLALYFWVQSHVAGGMLSPRMVASKLRAVFATKNGQVKYEERLIQDAVSHLPKRPAHFSVVLVNEDPDLGKLARLVCWAVAAGSNVVSLFDHNGQLKAAQEKFRKLLVEDAQDFFRDGSMKPIFNFHNTLKKNGTIPNSVKGDSKSAEIHIVLTSYEDGRPDLVRVARDECAAVLHEKKSPKEVKEDSVSEQLSATKGLPDPDLLLKCGYIRSMAGFLPWQIRLSEFYDIRSHRGVVVEQFVDSLYFYGKVEQRFGK